MEKDENGEELNINFSKLNPFKKRKNKKRTSRDEATEKYGRERNHENEEKEELNFDLRKVKGFFSKHSTLIIIILIIIFTLYIRLLPTKLGIMDDIARNNVYSYIKQNLKTQIEQQFPNLPEEQKNSYVENNFNHLLKTNNEQIELQVKQTSDYLKKEFQYQIGNKTYVFLGDLDSYHWLRYARNLLEKGMYGDEIRNGRPYDNLMVAPLGTYAYPAIHSYMIVFVYKMLKPFNNSLTLMQASFYVPVILSLIIAVFAFLIGNRIAGKYGGFLSSLLITINAFVIRRTAGSDDDIYNILFPVLIIWAFVEAVYAKDSKQRIIYSALSGLFTGLFALSWNGWWYLFDILGISFVLYFLTIIVYLVFAKKKSFLGIMTFFKEKTTKKYLLVILMYLAFSFVFVSVLKGPKFYFNAPIEALKSRELKASVKQKTLWPNIFTTVAELNAGRWDDILSAISNGYSNMFVQKMILCFSFIGLLLIVFNKKIIKISQGSEEKFSLIHNSLMPIIFFVWYAVAIYASLVGIRFLVLLMPVATMILGIELGLLVEFSGKELSRIFDLKKDYIVKVVVFAFILALMIVPVKAGIEAGRTFIPSINKTWYTALTKINENASTNAIINSWWDFGHWFKYFANRSVTADGATQNSPQTYWLGRLLVSEDEDESIAILRMLDCGSNNAFEEVDKEFNDTEFSVSVVRKIIMMTKENASNYLRNLGFSDEKILRILNYTHCEPPEDYLITSEDMIGKANVWAHFGLWDFRRAKILNAVKTMGRNSVDYMINNLNLSQEEARRYYDEVSILSSKEEEAWVSPWPGFITGLTTCSFANETKLNCVNMFQGQYLPSIVDLEKLDVVIPTNTKSIKPLSVVFATNDGIIEKEFNNSEFPYTLVVLLNKDQPMAFWCSKEISKSLFTRLYFMDAVGLNHFKLYTHESGVFGTNIYVWNVSWKPKEVVSKGDSITIDYIGYFENGTVFDSSIKNFEKLNVTKNSDFKDYLFRSPLKFSVGSGQVIKGLENQVLGMKTGEQKKIVVKPEEGYKEGELANKTLVFKVKVLRIE
ncbi:MAG: STT3 domain-containing protein [Candidatus Woesearchaeota archaeon]